MIIRNLIYILQIELYDVRKFLKFSYTHPKWWKLEQRAKLDWTKKASLIFAVSVFLMIIVIVLFFFSFGLLGLLIIFPIIILLPFFIVLALLALMPADAYLKKRTIQKAHDFLRGKKNLAIVGVTGSFGKTSTREILASILREKFKIIRLDENINTDLGIADFILRNPKQFDDKDIFIVEMGAYRRGDIRAICCMVKPDYSILTGINESHLERFGGLENIIKAKFELPEETGKTSVINIGDENIKNNYERFKIKNAEKVSADKIQNVKILDDFQGLEFEMGGVKFRTKLLAEHNLALIALAAEIAQKLGMSLQEISQGVEKIDYVPHRLQPIYNSSTNVWVIDDSYNGNLNGIVSGLDVLRRARGRKIVLTPGLVELGEKTREIHEKIGRLYAERRVDLVMLVKSPAARHIIDGMERLGFKNYKVYNSTKEAHDSLPEIIRSGDTIIFQNDLPDNYF